MTKETEQKLMETAIEYREKSYSPYSGFMVGAAVVTKTGEIFGGCNVENASYSVTNCAERTAIFKAVSEGFREFEAIAIVGAKKGERLEFCPPCGVCRQVMTEFCDPNEFKVLLGTSSKDYKPYLLRDLLPFGFTPKNLE